MKKAINLLGIIISIISLVYVGFLFKNYGQGIEFNQFNQNDIILLITLAILQAIFCYAPAHAWGNILQALNGQIKQSKAIIIFGKSQLAKYIPGNIFHYVGRQLLGQSEGIPAKILIKSSFLEIIISVAASSIFIIIFLIDYALTTTDTPNIYILITLIIIPIAILTINRFKVISTKITLAFLQYIAFFLLTGTLFLITIKIITPELQIDANLIIHILCTYVIGWLAGFIIPGAPAGLGVREVVLLSLIKAPIPDANLLLAIAILRGIQLSGEALFFINSTLKQRHTKLKTKQHKDLKKTS